MVVGSLPIARERRGAYNDSTSTSALGGRLATSLAREHAEAAAVRGRPRTLQVEEGGELAQVVAAHVVVVRVITATVAQADGELVGVECLRELQTSHSLVELVRVTVRLRDRARVGLREMQR